MHSPDMAPLKTPNTLRGTVSGSAYHNLVNLTIRAVPLPDDILHFILDNTSTLKQLQQRRNRDDELSFVGVEDIDEEESSTLHGDVIRKPTVKPEEFWVALGRILEAVGGEWKGIVERIWSFGPQRVGGCLLIDARKNPHQSWVILFLFRVGRLISGFCRLMRPIDRAKKIGLDTEVDEHDRDFDFDVHVDTGFQLATFQGPLCAEPVEGLAYFVESLETDRDGIKEIGTYILQWSVDAIDYFNSQKPNSRIDRVSHNNCQRCMQEWIARLVPAVDAGDVSVRHPGFE